MLTKSLKEKRDFVQQRRCKIYRKNVDFTFRKMYRKLHFSINKREALLLKYMCATEDPIVFKDEKIAFVRTNINVPEIWRNKDIRHEYKLLKGKFWKFCNVCINWNILLNEGLEARKLKATEFKNTSKDRKQRDFWDSVIISIDAVLNLAERYKVAAMSIGNSDVAESFTNVPKNPARNLKEALQSIRFVHSMFYLTNQTHMGLGRMDQYLYQFYKNDIDTGLLSKEDVKNLIAEFFISLNKDSDLYAGVQQGDNGQSIMLGGCKPEDGSSAINDLTYLILEVSRDLRLIDPKINLRIDSKTPEDLLELGCELTKCGLGFPQYSNDEIVIPALVKKGYSLEDARDYTVAACWEFIIPGKGADIVNVDAVSFPYAVDKAFEDTVKHKFHFSVNNFEKTIKKNIYKQVKTIANKKLYLAPSPLTSALYDGVIEKGADASFCAKYRNIGIHGAGSANAADAIAAIKIIFDESGIKGLKELLRAKKANFVGFDELFKKVHDYMPKVGNADDRVDTELKFLFDEFANAAEEYSNKGRNIRPGSGSAMYYIWHANPNGGTKIAVGTTADGKLKGEPLSSSLAPSHGIKVNGVLSVLKSYSNIDYSRIMNGGPITIELSPSVFNSDEGIKKLAQLLRYFVKLGNQQLQLNVLDASVLKDAIAHPEKHRNLIVRVWGWSGYFTELAPEYQQHVLNRHKYCI